MPEEGVRGADVQGREVRSSQEENFSDRDAGAVQDERSAPENFPEVPQPHVETSEVSADEGMPSVVRVEDAGDGGSEETNCEDDGVETESKDSVEGDHNLSESVALEEVQDKEREGGKNGEAGTGDAQASLEDGLEALHGPLGCGSDREPIGEEDGSVEDSSERRGLREDEDRSSNDGLEEQEDSPKEIRKSAKQAREELQEIYSEGQRMVRESSIRLPYHQPPKLSLKEFLALRRGEPSTESPQRTPEGQSSELSGREGNGIGREKPKRGRLAQLLEKELAAKNLLDITPKLSGGPLIIEAPSPGVEDLMQRFVKHAALGRVKKEKDAESPSRKEGTLTGIEASTPGEKRERLKQHLLEQVLKKREHVLEERLRQHKMNEEEEEEEEILSDQVTPPDSEEEDAGEEERGQVEEGAEEGVASADSDDEGQEDDEEEEEEEDIVRYRKRPRKRNPFLDDEAEDEDELADGEDSDDEDEDEEDERGQNREEHLSNPKCPVTAEEGQGARPRPAVNGSFASDDLELFSPISGLTNVRSRNEPQGWNGGPEESLIPLTPLFDVDRSAKKQAVGVKQVTGREKLPWQSSQTDNSQQEDEELLGLCSGFFPSRTNSEPREIEEEGSGEEEEEVQEEEDDGDDEIQEEEDEDEDDENQGEDEAPVHKNFLVDTTVEKKRFLPQDFLEEEAELSGSDVGSDEVDDDEDEEQVMADLLATDTQPLDEWDLREEVGKLHFKQLLDQDKRELRMYQELLLEDGDLHSEGGGRQRKFRWKNSGDMDSVDGPQQSDSEEGEQEDPQEEAAWRLQRFEREKWLREQASKGTEKSPEKTFNGSMRVVTSISREKQIGQKMVARESFLKMKSEALSRIADRFKASKAVDNTGALTTKSFVFRAVETKKETKRPPKTSLPGPSLKKPRTEIPVARGQSVFDYL